MASLPYPRSHKTIFPQNSRNTQKRLAEKKNLCTSVKSVGEYPPPEASVNSVGEYPPPEISVNSVNSVGGLAQTNLEWVLWKKFGGQRGYGRDAIPSYFGENQCNPWENPAQPNHLYASVQSVGGLAQTNLEWVLWKEFGGRRGYGRNAIPSYENSHGLHGCAQIRRQNAT